MIVQDRAQEEVRMWTLTIASVFSNTKIYLISVKLLYISAATAISIANEIFGFNGWSSEVKDLVELYVSL